MKRLAISLIGGLLWISLCDGQDATSWENIRRMPTPRSEIASAVVEGRIYVVGGVSIRGSLRAFEALDPGTGRWTRCSPLPEKLNHSGVAGHGRSIYVSGGFRDLFQRKRSDSLWRFDVDTGRWTKVARMPSSRVKHVMIERDGWLHLIGGLRHREIWSYQIEKGTWQTDRIPPLPDLRDHISVLQDGEALYVFGGRNGKVPQPDCWIHQVGRDRWSVLTRLPEARGGQTAVMHENRIHVVGGEDQRNKQTFRRYDIFDLGSKSWKRGPGFPVPRHGLTSERIGDSWYVIGGGRLSHLSTIVSASGRAYRIGLSGTQ